MSCPPHLPASPCPPPWDACRSHSCTSECRTVTPPEPSLPASVVGLIFSVPQSLYLKNGCDNGIPLSGLSWGPPAHTGKAPRALPASCTHSRGFIIPSLPSSLLSSLHPSIPPSVCICQSFTFMGRLITPCGIDELIPPWKA